MTPNKHKQTVQKANSRVQFSNSIVRIFNSKNCIVGMGVLTGERQVVTCAHVILKALDSISEKPLSHSKILLDFPLISPGELYIGRLLSWSDNDSEDIAELGLETHAPVGAEIAQLLSETDLWGHSFRVLGFPSNHEQGVWVDGVLQDRVSSQWIQLVDNDDIGYFVTPGFSGTPVWDSKLNGVVGIIVAVEKRPDIRAAFMIPSDRVLEAVRVSEPEVANKDIVLQLNTRNKNVNNAWKEATLDTLAHIFQIQDNRFMFSKSFSINEGRSTTIELKVGKESIEKVRNALYSNNRQLHLIGIEKVVLVNDLGQEENWITLNNTFRKLSDKGNSQRKESFRSISKRERAQNNRNIMLERVKKFWIQV